VAENYNLHEMVVKVKALRKTATELKSISGGIQAVDRNIDRILADVKLLEINLVEVEEILKEQGKF
jgi:hypothetical protein